MMNQATDRLTDVAIGLMVVLAVFLTVGSGSPLRPPIEKWLRVREMRRVARAEWPGLSVAGSQIRQADGPTQLVELSDYECPFCRLSAPSVDSAAEAGVRIRYIHFPLTIHPAAAGAARAAICAEKQGRFEAMHRRLMESTAWQLDTNWSREAELAGVANKSEFVACLTDPATTKRLADDIGFAKRLRISGTPAFVSMSGLEMGRMGAAELINLGSSSR